MEKLRKKDSDIEAMKKKVRDLRKRVNKESDYGLIVFLILAGCFLVASTVASVYYFN